MNSEKAAAHVIDLEQRLLDPTVRADPDRIAPLLHAEFIDHGTSGRIWTRQAVLDELPLEGTETPMVTGAQFQADVVAPGTILLTYVSTSTERTCNRSSLWLETAPDIWQMRFHQGTETVPTETVPTKPT